MIDGYYRTVTRLLGRAGLGLGLLLPLLLAACASARAAEEVGQVTDAATPTAALDSLRTTSTPIPAAPMASDFELPDLNGETWTLAQFRGQPVMLYFWATW